MCADTGLCLSCLLGSFTCTAAVASPATSSFSPLLFCKQVVEATQMLQPYSGHLLHPGKVKVLEMAWQQ